MVCRLFAFSFWTSSLSVWVSLPLGSFLLGSRRVTSFYFFLRLDLFKIGKLILPSCLKFFDDK